VTDHTPASNDLRKFHSLNPDMAARTEDKTIADEQTARTVIA
jgi:hypothetical protein